MLEAQWRCRPVTYLSSWLWTWLIRLTITLLWLVSVKLQIQMVRFGQAGRCFGVTLVVLTMFILEKSPLLEMSAIFIVDPPLLSSSAEGCSMASWSSISRPEYLLGSSLLALVSHVGCDSPPLLVAALLKPSGMILGKDQGKWRDQSDWFSCYVATNQIPGKMPNYLQCFVLKTMTLFLALKEGYQK